MQSTPIPDASDHDRQPHAIRSDGILRAENALKFDDRHRRNVAVSVVVPVVHRTRALPRCLAALCAQSLPNALFEIVVADGDPFGPLSLSVCVALDRFRRLRSTGPSVHYMPAAREWGDAAARNAGWRVAAAPIVAFVDPDDTPDREWLRTGLMSIAAGWDATDLSTHCHAEVFDGPATTCFSRKRALDAVGGLRTGTAAGDEESDALLARLAARGFLVRRGASLRRSGAPIDLRRTAD